MSWSIDKLTKAVAADAAIRRVRRLQPAGGPGDKIFPPTYPGEGQNAPARHAFETRRIDGQDIRCVLIDSVQSQANRLEEALLEAVRAGRIQLPLIEVDFTGQEARGADLSDLGVITSLDAPHRVFDAILRDSDHDGTEFMRSEIGLRLQTANMRSATALFEVSPTALLFGAWNSTGEGGGLGAKFPRCLVSEIVGVNAVPGRKVSSRIDPLGIKAEVKIYEDAEQPTWTPFEEQAKRGKDGKPVLYARKQAAGERGKPSVINHSNVRPDVSSISIRNAEEARQVELGRFLAEEVGSDVRASGGVTIDWAIHTSVISFAGLRRLGFPPDGQRSDLARDDAARAALAALGLVALTGQDRAGYALRSRCDLVPEGPAPFQLVRADGSTEQFDLDPDGAVRLFDAAVQQAQGHRLPWRTEATRLTPQPRLVELVALSRQKALAGEAEPDESA